MFLEFLLHDLYFDEIGGSWDADRDSRDDDHLLSFGDHSQFLWHPLRPLQHLICIFPVGDQNRIDSPAEIEPPNR